MKPVVVQVFGDKGEKLEPEEHRIHFPGGCIAVARTSDGEYWAHISVNTPAEHKHHNGDFTEGHTISKTGQVVGSRIDFDHDEYTRRHDLGKPTIPKLPNEDKIHHIAVRLAIADHD